ncbi:hypothetical protein SERLADRAFT_440916 [Serpula lacrymans var. lacrymans S7.9]|uniref:Phosphoglucomutase n=1 Tax=Serpula lacrymans var. lacrymans (strain S7.9) TaxID=578457 RepID=F8P4Y3_SERL9|nr:uncharacterized protein SERLADRAFT_440916 [Serpula lacrymans var. lacrymans S7.9]EGO21670.1 hypothetical protein SERLADRAFT_440916 [Serpula lacrymans var. lacrymans S7.9]
MTDQSLEDLVKEWLRLDKNSSTRAEIEHLWKNDAIEELERRMRPRIEFGTAGLRGKMEAGWSRINDLIVIQASQGLCAYVLEHVDNVINRGVVVGHDHRHNSERWAQLTAAVFIANNIKVYLHRGLVHTPLVPFTVKRTHAACGIMITAEREAMIASHNPKQDNGYKVYWENAVQIIGPHDKGISDSIKVNLEPLAWTTDQIHASALCLDRTQEMEDEYFSSLTSLNISRSLNSASEIKYVNTSMHGVSHPFVSRAFKTFGFAPFIPVKEQQEPDPEFPTVYNAYCYISGALNLSLATAEKEDALYVLAQDPDSDRFTAAEKGHDGEWFTFTGDQLGALFAAQVLEQYKYSGKPLSRLAMVASTVSSKMIEAMASVEGFKFVECLTGFKFIGNTALDLVRVGYEVPFGYEEAIGYMFGSEIRDKDGVAATMVFAQLAAGLRQRGRTVRSLLEELYERSVFEYTGVPPMSDVSIADMGTLRNGLKTRNSYFICTDPKTVENIFDRIRSYGPQMTKSLPSYPPSIAGLTITSVVDLTEGHGYDSNTLTCEPVLPLSSGQMIQFRAKSDTEDGTKIVLTIRTSGTEPKIKYYLEGNGKNAKEVGRLLPLVVRELGEVWMEATKNELGQP